MNKSNNVWSIKTTKHILKEIQFSHVLIYLYLFLPSCRVRGEVDREKRIGIEHHDPCRPILLQQLYSLQNHLLIIVFYLQYGLYSSFMGCFIYIVFGSCKDITLGPTALLALMTYQQIQGRNADYAILLCFLSGVVQFVMGLLHLGKLLLFLILEN